MKDNALIPKHVDEMHPSVHPEREEIGMVIPLIQMMADILKSEKWRGTLNSLNCTHVRNGFISMM